MDSNIVNNETVRMAYQLAGFTHQPIEEIMMAAVREYANRVLAKEPYILPIPALKDPRPLKERVADIQKAVAALPILDNRTPEEIIGYDEYGALPHGN